MNDPRICHMLPWDSAFFGVRIARVQGCYLTPERLASIDTWCAEQSVDCLYFLAVANDAVTVTLAETSGFHLVDVRITYERALESHFESSTQGANLRIRTVEERDVMVLSTIAGVNHSDTRFFFDPRFSAKRAAQLYETWIEKSCAGYADAVLVAEIDGLAVGYITCQLDQDGQSGSIGLVGVGPTARGRGIGQALVGAAVSWIAGQGARSVSVVTQGRNVVAQRLYQRAGFVTATVQLWYHRWSAAT